MKLFSNMFIKNNILYFGGKNTLELAKKYATPLYLIDGNYIKQQYGIFKKSMEHPFIEPEIIYASKALSTKAIYEIMNQLEASIDVVSGGELYTALESGFPPEKIYFHGNNKSPKEIMFALDKKVGTFVVDNLMELEFLAGLNRQINILLRINPGIKAQTHHYVQTALESSKFGISLSSQDFPSAIQCIINNKNLILRGFHCHIGSQIHSVLPFIKAAKILLDATRDLKIEHGIELETLNIGGGFGIYYNPTDETLAVDFLSEIINFVGNYVKENKLKIKKLMIEPGRSLVGPAGMTLYEVGFIKETPGLKKYVFIDGGMTDNIRPTLYQSIHEACVISKMKTQARYSYTIAGKCCESGDELIQDILLPKVQTGDFIGVSNTGAYNYSMASNYNRIPRPAMVLIENKEDRIIIRRETYEDLISKDI